MKKSISILTALVFTLMASYAYADTLKIGIVDMNQVLQKSPLMVSMNQKLTEKFKPRQDEVNKAQKQLQEETDQFNLNSATMSAEDRNKAQDKIIADKANAEVLNSSFQRDLTLAKNQALQTFTTKLSAVINKIADDGNYDIIQQRTDIIYANKRLDITEQVLQEVK